MPRSPFDYPPRQEFKVLRERLFTWWVLDPEFGLYGPFRYRRQAVRATWDTFILRFGTGEYEKEKNHDTDKG